MCCGSSRRPCCTAGEQGLQPAALGKGMRTCVVSAHAWAAVGRMAYGAATCPAQGVKPTSPLLPFPLCRFLGKWGEPAAWLNARLAYTRTTAVWCMVGHIVGLGDRHGENILVGWLGVGCWWVAMLGVLVVLCSDQAGGKRMGMLCHKHSRVPAL